MRDRDPENEKAFLSCGMMDENQKELRPALPCRCAAIVAFSLDKALHPYHLHGQGGCALILLNFPMKQRG